MELTTIINHCYRFPGFIYERAKWSADKKSIEVRVRPRVGSAAVCSRCHQPGCGYDHLDERRFEFIPFWGLLVFFLYRMRRVSCQRCGVTVEEVPWAKGKHRLTRAYMQFLAHWARKLSWKEVAESFQTSWEKVCHSVEYVVQWGLRHRVLEPVRAIGVDEIQYARGHNYLTLVYQIEEGPKRLLWVGKDRTIETLEGFFAMLGESLSAQIEFVCSDMWQPYLRVIREKCSQAIHILDRFHIVAKMNKALDEVRAGEARKMVRQGYEPLLKKTRWCLLKRKDNLSTPQRFRLRDLLHYNLGTVRAYLLKEDFQQLWEYSSPTWAGKFLDEWCRQTMRSRIEAMKKVARMLRSHRQLILNYFRAKKQLSSGVVEGLNNKAKLTMRKSYGFRTFRITELALYHALGKLPEPQLTPQILLTRQNSKRPDRAADGSPRLRWTLGPEPQRGTAEPRATSGWLVRSGKGCYSRRYAYPPAATLAANRETHDTIMCGICGQLNFDGKPAQARDTEAMVRTLDHRGPDDRGVYAHGPASIGIARLKVIDLETGHQPVRNEDGSIWCVLNGEIYNYRELRETLSARGHYFQTQSNTETIVHLYEEYGAALAEHLRGMFAIALWDQSRQQLLLIRDRLGVKPLYYYLDAERLVFGSELKALLAAGIPREVDPQATDDYLTHGYVPGEGSIFRNVHKLLPAHSLLIQRSGSRELNRYWDLLDPRWDAEHSAASDPAERAQATWERLKEAVRYRLVSDVPIGVLLSGGIDSTAIVAAMREVTSQPIKTFTVGFQDESYDESGLARLTAERFETEHHELVAQIQASEIVPSYIHHLDEPYAESSAIPIYCVSRLAREHITVALGGDGGDELFGGYNHYAASRYMEWYKKLPRALSQGLVPWAVGQLPVSHRRASFDYLAKRFVSAVELSPEQAQLKWLEVIADDVKQRLYGPALRDRSEALPAFRYYEQHLDQARRQEGINRLMFMDSRIYLPDGILTKVDRMSMAHSLETRGPFLDHKLVEFGHRLPCGVKMRGLTRKYLLKQLLRGRVPRQVLSQKKMGFVLPLARWLCGDLRELLCDTLSADRLRRTGYFDPAAVEHLINRHLARREDHSKTLWSLLVFQLWLDRYVTERAPS